MSFLTGTPGRFEQRSTLGPEQQGLYGQLQNSAMQRGAGGAFGASADYYRSLLDEDNDTFNTMAAPEQRRFNEQIIPDLSEQFAGMGSGALSSSGFRNAAVNAGTDLSERLGAIRAQLRQQGAAGLSNIGQFGLGQFNENIYQKGQPGLIDVAGPALGVAGAAFGGPIGAAAGNAIGNWATSSFGKSNPYGGGAPPAGAAPHNRMPIGGQR